MPNSNIRINNITEKDTNQSVEVSKLAPIGAADGAVIYVDTVSALQGLDTSVLMEGQPATVKGSPFKLEEGEWRPVGAVSVEAFGAVGDGTTDNKSAFQAAFDYAQDFCPLLIPKGEFYIPNTGSSLSFSGSLSIQGSSKEESVIFYDDSAQTNNRRDLINTQSAKNFEIKHVTIKSDWGENGDYTERSQILQVAGDGTGSLSVKNCVFMDCRFMANSFSKFKQAYITGCVYKNVAADGCRVVESDSVIVTDNYFESVNDDSIAIHTRDSADTPLFHNVIVSNNQMVDSQGIAVLGAKHCTIHGNTVTRPHTRGIMVGVGSPHVPEGHTPPLGIVISNNVVTDVFRGSVFSSLSGGGSRYIILRQDPLTQNSGGNYVETGDGQGGVLSPYGGLYNNETTDPGVFNVGGWFVSVENNICVRTLQIPVSNYSDYGFGERLGRSGPVDPNINSNSLSNSTMVSIEGAFHGLRVSSNIVSGGGAQGIYLNGEATDDYATWRNCEVKGNVVTNIEEALIRVRGSGSVNIESNTLNGDPFHTNSERESNGRWSSSFEDSSAFWLAGSNSVVKNNTIRNVGTVFRGATTDSHIWDGNTIFGNFEGLGSNQDNQGIRDIRNPSIFGSVCIEDSDPDSPTFNQVLNVCLTTATAVPDSGRYLVGHFVRNAAATLSSPYGWLRVTNGDDHVLGTDWREID